MGPREGPVLPNQKRLHRLLDGLLAMEYRILRGWWNGREIDLRIPEVIQSFA